MFKKTVLIAAAIFVVASLAGCGSKAAQNDASTTTTAQSQQAGGQTANGITLPSDKPAYIGKVVDVANDQVKIYKAELPAQPQGTSQTTNQEAPQEPPQGTTQDAQGGANGKGPGPGGQMNFSEQAETIVIPASAQVLTGSPGGGNISSVKVSDIKQDQIIQVWEKDGVITFVQVMEGNGNMPNDGSQQPKGGQQLAGERNN